MKVAIYNSKAYEIPLFNAASPQHELVLLKESLSLATAHYAKGCGAVAYFVTDCLDAEVIH